MSRDEVRTIWDDLNAITGFGPHIMNLREAKLAHRLVCAALMSRDHVSARQTLSLLERVLDRHVDEIQPACDAAQQEERHERP